MTGRVEYRQYDSVRWLIAAVLLAAATLICLGLARSTPGHPARLTVLLALPILVASVLCFARRAERWARWLAIYGWVAALVLYLQPLGEVWPFGVLTGAVVAALALTASLLIPDTASRRSRRAAPGQRPQAD